MREPEIDHYTQHALADLANENRQDFEPENRKTRRKREAEKRRRNKHERKAA